MTTLSPGLSSLTLDLRDLKVCPRPTRQPSLLASGKDMNLGGVRLSQSTLLQGASLFLPYRSGWVAGGCRRGNPEGKSS